ncbi:MAG TPA: tetratricopeptide repeat protein [Thermoanaerobaculia bacterium]|nr:tetratricopeptide repeat protein [Thermoanaerobaculia bacterium]
MKVDLLPIVISACALVLSLTSTIFSLRQKRDEMLRTWRDQLTKIVSEIVKVDSEISSSWLVDQNARDERHFQKMSVLTQQITSLVRQAVFLAEKDPRHVADVEYVSIARALVYSGDLGGAKEYWERAVAASPSAYYRVSNTRAYADYLFANGRHEQARAQYRAALSLLDNTTDFSRNVNVYTYQMWMVSEAGNLPAPYNAASECYRNAKGLAESITSATTRANALQLLEQSRVRYGMESFSIDSSRPGRGAGVP